MAHQIKGGK